MNTLRPSPYQFARTRPIRLAVYRKARLSLRRRVLDVGAGGGEVAAEMASRMGRKVWALDLEPAIHGAAGVIPVAGTAAALPFADGSFDAVAFHFVLLWLNDPVACLREAHRVLAPGGVAMILSEPDLTRREDEPDAGLGAALRAAVRRAGGHPDAGSRLAGWLWQAAFRPDLCETPGEWVSTEDPQETDWEIEFLVSTGTLGSEEGTLLRKAMEMGGPSRVRLPIAFGCGWRT
ncbi:MAG: class I SAM-dependent methyltransferase [Acidobacteriota bacterium]